MTELKKDEAVYNAIEELANDIALISTATTAMDEMNKEMYGNVANYIHHSLSNVNPTSHGTDAGLITRTIAAKKALRKLEQLIKDKHEVTSLPTSYRSSKSVLLKAISLGIYIYGEDGKVQPKSVLEKKIKGRTELPDGGKDTATTKARMSLTDHKEMRTHLLEAHRICVDNNWVRIAERIQTALDSTLMADSV